MKLYDFGPAANAQRVRMFLSEKGLSLPLVDLNVRDGSQFKEPFNTLNPFHCVPFLELDDGTVIAESVSICRYIEEMHPEPSLFGRTAVERATVDMWNRRLELDGFIPILHAARNHLPAFQGRVVPGTRDSDVPQLPALVDRGKVMLDILLARLEPHMGRHPFVAGSGFTVADITGYFVLVMAKRLEMDIESDYPNIFRWYTEVAARPSARF